MMTRRQALKTTVLAASATALGSSFLHAQTAPAAATPPPSGPFTLPPLGYAFDALEPHIDAKTMEIHHDKHHQAYVTNLNKAVAGKSELEGKSIEELLTGLAKLPEAVRTAVRNHGGGHYNHSLFWKTLRKGGAGKPTGKLAGLVDKSFGSFDAFKTQFTQKSLQLFGSGWVWVVLEKGQLILQPLPNQDSPLLTSTEAVPQTPLLGIDLWEHAYYLKYQNVRASYIEAFFNVIDWDAVAERVNAKA